MTHITLLNSYSGYLDVKKKELSVVGKVNSEGRKQKICRNSFLYSLTFPKAGLMIEII